MLLVTCTPESIETNGLSVPHCSIGVIADAAAQRTAPPGLANGLEVLMRSADYLIVDGTVEIDNSHHTCLVTTEIVGSDVKQPSLENGSQVICVDNVDDSRPAMAIATVQKLKLIGPASV